MDKMANAQPERLGLLDSYYEKYGVKKTIEGRDLFVIPRDYPNEALVAFAKIFVTGMRPQKVKSVPASTFSDTLDFDGMYPLPSDSILDPASFSSLLSLILHEYRFKSPRVVLSAPAIARPVNQGGEWIRTDDVRVKWLAMDLYRLFDHKGIGDTRTLTDSWLNHSAGQFAVEDPALSRDVKTLYHPELQLTLRSWFEEVMLRASAEDCRPRYKSDTSPGPIFVGAREYWAEIQEKHLANAANMEALKQSGQGNRGADSQGKQSGADHADVDELPEERDARLLADGLLIKGLEGKLTAEDIRNITSKEIRNLLSEGKFKEVIAANFSTFREFIHPQLRHMIKRDRYSVKADGHVKVRDLQMRTLESFVKDQGGVAQLKNLSVGEKERRIEELIWSYCLSVATVGYRFNSLDHVTNANLNSSIEAGNLPVLSSKKRAVKILREGKVFTGWVDPEALMSQVKDLTGDTRLNAARLRPIVVHSYASQFPFHVLASALSWFKRPEIEKGLMFLSEHPECAAMWDSYKTLAATLFGDDVVFVYSSGDISHAESFASSNFSGVLDSYPTSFRDYIELSSTSVQLLPDPYLLTGLQSGQAFTTLHNVVQGLHLFYYYLCLISDEDPSALLSKYTDRIRDRGSFIHTTVRGVKVLICNFLPTDDQPIAFAVRSADEGKLRSVLEKHNEMMKEVWNAGFDQPTDLRSFGMTLTRSGFMERSRVSSTYKILYFEHPNGNLFANERSMALRYYALPRDLKAGVNDLFIKHLKIDLRAYRLETAFDPIAMDFFSVADFGLNEHKPSDKALIDELNRLGSLLDPSVEGKDKRADLSTTAQWLSFWSSKT